MKNLLSENMLRFGTKNLSESSQKELIVKSIMQTINEHGLHNAVRRSLLTEQTEVDLLVTQAKEASAANMSFKSQLAKKIYSPSYLFANKQYYLVTTKPYAEMGYTKNLSFDGKVVSFQNYIVSQKEGGTGINLPLISDYRAGWGGGWNHDGIKFTSMTWKNTPGSYVGPASRVASNINSQMDAIPLADIQALYTAHPNKARFVTSIAAFKANTTPFATALKAALGGNAKAFLGV